MGFRGLDRLGRRWVRACLVDLMYLMMMLRYGIRVLDEMKRVEDCCCDDDDGYGWEYCCYMEMMLLLRDEKRQNDGHS